MVTMVSVGVLKEIDRVRGRWRRGLRVDVRQVLVSTPPSSIVLAKRRVIKATKGIGRGKRVVSRRVALGRGRGRFARAFGAKAGLSVLIPRVGSSGRLKRIRFKRRRRRECKGVVLGGGRARRGDGGGAGELLLLVGREELADEVRRFGTRVVRLCRRAGIILHTVVAVAHRCAQSRSLSRSRVSSTRSSTVCIDGILPRSHGLRQQFMRPHLELVDLWLEVVAAGGVPLDGTVVEGGCEGAGAGHIVDGGSERLAVIVLVAPSGRESRYVSRRCQKRASRRHQLDQ